MDGVQELSLPISEPVASVPLEPRVDVVVTAQMQALANAFTASLNDVLETLNTGASRILDDLKNGVEEGAERGTTAGVASVAESVTSLLALLQNGSAREAVLSPMRVEAAATARATAEAAQNEARAAITQIRDDARQIVAHAVPRIATSWLLAGMLAMVTLLTIATVLDVRGWSGSTYNAGYTAGERDEMLRQAAFYAGLDRDTKALIDRHNARQARDARLYFHSVSGG